jgi:hypothetical protein
VSMLNLLGSGATKVRSNAYSERQFARAATVPVPGRHQACRDWRCRECGREGGIQTRDPLLPKLKGADISPFRLVPTSVGLCCSAGRTHGPTDTGADRGAVGGGAPAPSQPVTDLTASGYVVKLKDGRRNRCRIQAHLPLREAITQERTIGEVLDILVESKIPRQR